MGFFKDLCFMVAERVKSGVIKIIDAITKFFHNALGMMKTVLNKLALKLRKPILGMSHFIRKVGNMFQEGTKSYTLDEELGEWNETTVTREVQYEDIPEKYQRLDDEFEIDDTVEMDACIEMEG